MHFISFCHTIITKKVLEKLQQHELMFTIVFWLFTRTYICVEYVCFYMYTICINIYIDREYIVCRMYKKYVWQNKTHSCYEPSLILITRSKVLIRMMDE